ncbi:MAG: hypothetical protein E7650_06915 [Ruminococcaceae bacterium]|nr:hypothetical protein [Oscillospiraceae bacterium]
MPSEQLLFRAIQAAMTGATVEPPATEEEMAALYKLAKRHDMAHLLAAALQGKLLQGDVGASLHRQYMTAIFRTEQLQSELAALTDALEEAEIPFIPLKGSVLRARYPEPWLRSSCDIDVLVHESDVTAVKTHLARTLGYTEGKGGPYDLSLYAPGGVHVEVHFALSATCDTAADALLSRVWEFATPAGQGAYRHVLADEMLYFYHIAHMAKHFVHGGCGVRPFLDLSLLDRAGSEAEQRRDALLTEGGLLRFAQSMRAVAAYWFANGAQTPLCLEVERFILSGGSYGTRQNSVKMRRAVHRKGKLSFLLSRIFLPYSTIKYMYPVLQRHRWLTPFFEVRRWFSLLFSKSARRLLRRTVRAGKEELADDRAFLREVGL